MSNILCSKVYQDFFNGLPDENVSILALLQHIRKTIPPVMQALSIARLEMHLLAPSTPYDREGKNTGLVIYEEDSYEDTPITREYTTGEDGLARFIVYPKKDYTWSEDENSEISFLIKNLFFLTGRARVMELMSKVAITDALTGFPNTAGLTRYSSMLSAQGRLINYSGLFMNLKNFKYINQRIGSRSGDDVIRKYASAITAFVQPEEMIARLGGDNFFALIKNEHVQDFLQAAEMISINMPMGSSLLTFSIGVKVGIYPAHPGDTIHDLMNGASLAMSMAKNSITHDAIWFRPSMLEKIVHRKEISNLFPQALSKHEFIVYYQPKVNLDDNTLYGCEALVRWVRDGQLVPPMDFIPILEQEGSICMLDFYVFERVCQDIRDWLDAGIEPVRTSVNFSKLHLHNKHLAQDILNIMEKYHLDSKYIEIELTETSGYEDFSTLNHFVNAMKEHGIRTSLDDFGTGYSSLNLLKDLNVDIIKLDKSFLKNIENHNSSDEIVIETIVNMVKALNMQVVAEGVETSGQANYLRSIHCHLAQGYLFDKPLPHDDFEKCLTGEKKYDPNL